MTRWIVAMCVALAVQSPLFRSRTDAVQVTVTVRDKEKAITDLTSADFQLLDSGVPQEITSAMSESVPVDAALVLDTSGSLEGAAFIRLKRDIQSMAALLKSDDRVRLVTFASRVIDVLGLQPGNTTLPLDRMSAGGSTSLQNALATALMIAPSTERAQLAFAVTDGQGTASFIDPRRLVKLAEYTSTTLYVALVPVGGRQTIDSLEPQFRTSVSSSGYIDSYVVTPSGAPRAVPHREALQDTVRATGGILFDARQTDSLPSLFRRVLQDFRQSYVLRYTPRGVPSGGWHDVVVKLPKHGNLVVRARKGYEGS